MARRGWEYTSETREYKELDEKEEESQETLEELRAALESVPEDSDDDIARQITNERYTGLEGNLEGYGTHTVEEGRYGFDGQLQEDSEMDEFDAFIKEIMEDRPVFEKQYGMEGNIEGDFSDLSDPEEEKDVVVEGDFSDFSDLEEEKDVVVEGDFSDLSDPEEEKDVVVEGDFSDLSDPEEEKDVVVEGDFSDFSDLEVREDVVGEEKLQEEVEERAVQRAELEYEKEEERLQQEAEEKARREAEQERLRLEAEKQEKERQELMAFMEQIRIKEEEKRAKEEERKNNPYKAISEDMELLETITDEVERRRIQEFICQEALIGVFRENENRENFLSKGNREARFTVFRTEFVDRCSIDFYEKLRTAGSYDKDTILQIMRETIIDSEMKTWGRNIDEKFLDANPLLEGLTAEDKKYIAEHYDFIPQETIQSEAIVQNGEKYVGFVAFEPPAIEQERVGDEIHETVPESTSRTVHEVSEAKLAAYDIDEIDDSEMETIQGGIERRAQDIAQQQINDEFRKAILREREARRITPDGLDLKKMGITQGVTYQSPEDISQQVYGIGITQSIANPRYEGKSQTIRSRHSVTNLEKADSMELEADELDIDEMENIQGGVYQKQKDINEEMANEYRSQYQNKDLETSAIVKDVPQKENWIERFKLWYNQGKQLPNQERHSTMKNIMNAIRESIRLNRNRSDIDNKRER